MKQKCAKVRTEAVEEAIKNLESESQKEAVRACFNSSKVTDKRGLRYTTDWIYECLLLKIKSPRAYNHLRDRKILALPSPQLLKIYTSKIRAAYGYDDATFKLLKKKTEHMQPDEVRGKINFKQVFLLSWSHETFFWKI